MIPTDRPEPDSAPTGDPWADWLLRHRHGGDRATLERMLSQVSEFRDTVLAGARIAAGDVVLDVGCGDGLLGIAALPEVGTDGTVIFSDVSAELLERCRHIAADLGALDRCRFVHTGLPELPAVATGSVDVAVARSVLLYVDDKAGCFAALYRVLRPGGRLSIFEPINRFGGPDPDGRLWGFDLRGLEPIAERVRQAYHRHLPPENSMTNFDERDLIAAAEAAGFETIQLDLRATVGYDATLTSPEALLRHAPNPLVPPLGEILDEVLTGAQRAQLVERIAAQLRAGRRRRRLATAYLVAQR